MEFSDINKFRLTQNHAIQITASLSAPGQKADRTSPPSQIFEWAHKRPMDDDAELKVVLVGTSSVGKTSIVQRATTGLFDEACLPTLGASYTVKSIQVGRRTCRLQIWDTAGQERYRSITPMYYRGAQAALIVYSVVDRDSFEYVDTGLATFRENSVDSFAFVVANKCDLADEGQVTRAEGKQKAQAHGALFAEVSAMTGEGIEGMFAMVAESCLGSPSVKEPKPGAVDIPEPNPGKGKAKKKACAC
jgi:small GTP-binding protein